MTNTRFGNIRESVRAGSFPTPAKHLSLVVLKIDKAEGMEPLPQGYLPGGRVVGMGAVVVDRERVVNIQDATVVTA